MRYNGLVVSKKPYHNQGDIIVDHQIYKLESSDSSNFEILDISGERTPGPFWITSVSKFNDMECSSGTHLQPAQYLLLPAYVIGFAREKREWTVFDMSFVENLEENETGSMDNVIIDPAKRELIEAAVAPREDPAWNPGTDLGTEEVQMEKRLMKWLDRATTWGVIVLIDEAEVYLDQRQTGTISRNALVTAFLRTMEYFPGLFFLTSNGIGLLDEAVMWRIHLTIRDVALSRDSYPENFQLNGRDIRNMSNIDETILLSTISVARFKALNASRYGEAPAVIKVKVEQLQKVLENRENFNEDYKRATACYSDQMAAERFLRSGGAGGREES
ncbi:hypothetical protein QQZ08_001722 [Neonectria magnoliae]|uniref:ATPase AAA-type core domain-containing protein n=1 Tax=Neonectria magnoliae TaxID=2732573 RepID=A0ABR1IFL9_9HYPO